MLSTIPHQIITQQAENTTVTWPVIPTALRSKRRNYNRQMRRTLRRNQAVTRPPSSRTRLSSPRSHVICSPRFHIKSSLSKRRTPLQLGRSTSNHHSASEEHHCNLAYHPHYIEEQEEELQQANAENTAEKPSGNKATIVKNTAQLSKIPRHISHPLKEEQEEELQQANAENTAEKPSGNKATIVRNTAQLSKIPRHMLSTVPHQIITQRKILKRRTPLQLGLSSPLEEQEEELQQANAENTDGETKRQQGHHQEELQQNANAENTAEKPSGNKATIVRNTAQLSKIPRHMLSTVPHQIITQQAENTTATWPVIPTALIWYITAMTSQEEDLLRRSQSIGPLQEGHRTMHIWTN
ncbi:hypothetical protein HO173_013275 [Letharia columbiana]|uniref:Uncharacterized protein n=1 Tax=Letharia columbiana TaxID=112416 RepID=A0A8H6CGK5_9LECA|nr:uncharacterized protein HO173_013275 [Letharia columbiana]KAF6223138.1 hypothetical protein HO173_013275 [Letharia columbiana]